MAAQSLLTWYGIASMAKTLMTCSMNCISYLYK